MNVEVSIPSSSPVLEMIGEQIHDRASVVRCESDRTIFVVELHEQLELPLSKSVTVSLGAAQNRPYVEVPTLAAAVTRGALEGWIDEEERIAGTIFGRRRFWLRPLLRPLVLRIFGHEICVSPAR